MATLRVPVPVPSPAEDAEQLYKACKGWGTNEKALISILAHRDASHRKQIMVAYEERYKENLIKRLESELSGRFERAVYRWMFDPHERAAILSNVALKEKKENKEDDDIDFSVIIETACADSPGDLLAIKQAYQSRYNSSLEDDIALCAHGDLRKLLVVLVSAYRSDDREEIDVGLARTEAGVLREAIRERNYGNDEMIRILATRSKAQLNATFTIYEEDFNTSITKSLSKSFEDPMVYALLIAIRCIIDPRQYFEKLLNHALSASKTVDDEALTRVIVTRAEKDLKVIKEMYYKRTSVQLERAVEEKTSGDYKRFLLALIGN